MISVSVLEIERPERWAKQLLSHLSNKSELQGNTLKFGFGASGTVIASETCVFMIADADTQETLDRAQDVLGKHLYRFAKIEDKTPSWTLVTQD
jgi:hypothetical protein